MDQSRKVRRLAAIMFTDIIGYTALMQENEHKANAVRVRHRRVFAEKHQTYQGEILQYFGDGTLSIFQSGVEAIACAVAIQKGLQGGEAVPLRIGLHLGDIVFDGTEIYGDSVNLASRIESMGVAGAVLLSGRLNEELLNQPQFSTVSLGHFEFKNVIHPIEVFAIQDQALVVPQPLELKGKGKRAHKTIAVLPFVNRSADPDNEYFSDGMTEEIINALAQIKGLKVTSRSSSFHFKNKNLPIKEIGANLNVSTILEGSIRLSKNKLRITAQLIDVNEDVHFWSETFDRLLDDIFAVQDEISLLIADKLREHIGHFDIAEQLVTPPDISVENYQFYLQARYHILKMSKPDLEKGIAILKEMVKKHPKFALGFLGIHLGYTLLGTMGFIPATDAFASGRPYLDQAIDLDDRIPECQLHLSYDTFLPKWDLQGAYEHLQKSFEIRPTVEYYQSMASMLVVERKYEAAFKYLETAIQIDPFSFINFHLQGYIHYCREEYKTAIRFFDEALKLNPHFTASILYKGQALVLSNQAIEALAHFENLPSEGQNDVSKLAGMTLANIALNRKPEIEKGMAELEKARESRIGERAMDLLILCKAMLNRKEETLQLIEKGIEVHLPMLVYIFIDPILKSFRPHPKFQKLMQLVLGKENSFQAPKRKYKKSLFDEVDLKKYCRKLKQIMLEEKPYLDPDLTLRDLAALLNLPPNHMSQLLNEGFDKNFSAFVNTYRLENYKAKALDPANQHLTILGLAYESGFNSKTVFNSFFKKMEAMSPKAWLKSIQGNTD
ncbi:MAG: helix-turn-helix domain-containing protein [Bacteroidota bacterium]